MRNEILTESVEDVMDLGNGLYFGKYCDKLIIFEEDHRKTIGYVVNLGIPIMKCEKAGEKGFAFLETTPHHWRILDTKNRRLLDMELECFGTPTFDWHDIIRKHPQEFCSLPTTYFERGAYKNYLPDVQDALKDLVADVDVVPDSIQKFAIKTLASIKEKIKTETENSTQTQYSKIVDEFTDL